MFLRQVIYVLAGFYWQYSNREKLEKRQLNKLRKLLSHSRRSVPIYSNDRNYDISLGTLEDVGKLPILRKCDLQDSGKEFQDQSYIKKNKAILCITSGSTGEPTRIYHDKFCFDYHTAVGVRRVLATGKYSPTYRLLHIRPVPLKKRLFEYLGLFRREIIPASLPIKEIKKIILKYRPDGLVGYPVYLRDLIASLTQEELYSIRKNLKILFTESEMLTKSHRDFIEKSFGVEIFDDYSAYETLSITFECSHHRHHIVEDRLFLEILDDEGRPVADGVEGNIVLTSFLERAMPIIRYGIGDRGILSSCPCPCGRTFKTLELTQGRAEDYILLSNGEKIYSATILHMAAQLNGVREVYLYQNQAGEVTIYYVPFNWITDFSRIEKFIRNYFKEYCSVPFHFSICPSESIPRTKGGKARLIYSELADREVSLEK